MTEYQHHDNPLVSIVMPVKNGERFISESIQSVIGQTYRNWELLIVNDHSEDQTVEIVRRFMKKDRRIKLITLKKKRSGVAYSRRCGIDFSSGTWIAFLDSDDIWSLNKLRIQMELINFYEYKFLFTASAFIGMDGKRKKYVFHAPSYISYPDILKQDVISCSSVIISKSLLNDSFYEHSNQICDDYAAWIRVLRDHVDRAIGIDVPLLQYRISRTSLSFNKIESALRTYRTYRHVGISKLESIYYWCQYVLRSLKKYTGVYFQ